MYFPKPQRSFTKPPLLPLSALIFYALLTLLSHSTPLPAPSAILHFLEGLYVNYGLIGLGIAAFLEGLAYIGLYFPGSLIIILAVILSDGSLGALMSISLVTALALTCAVIVNYISGRILGGRHALRPTRAPATLWVACMHPNSLGFYFFNAGLQRHSVKQLFLVPVIMLPYGFILAAVLSFFHEGVKVALDTPYVTTFILLVWLGINWIQNARQEED